MFYFCSYEHNIHTNIAKCVDLKLNIVLTKLQISNNLVCKISAYANEVLC